MLLGSPDASPGWLNSTGLLHPILSYPAVLWVLLSPLIPGETVHSRMKLVAVGMLLSLSGHTLSPGWSSTGHLKVVAKGDLGVLANFKV